MSTHLTLNLTATLTLSLTLTLTSTRTLTLGKKAIEAKVDTKLEVAKKERSEEIRLSGKQAGVTRGKASSSVEAP